MDLSAQIETLWSDISSNQFGQALIDAAPVLTTIGGFVKGLGFAAGPMTAEEHTKCGEMLQKCLDACEKAAKKVDAPVQGKLGDGSIAKALANLLTLALQFWPLIAPFIKP